MEHICLDLEGVLVPEIWAEVAKHTGEDKFKLTSQDLKDYSELMDMRMDLVKSLKIRIKDINAIVDSMEPFEGAKEFLDWVRDNFQLTIVSDSFYELAWPLIRKLGTPSINCHYLDIEDGELVGYKLRQSNNKQKVVQALKEMKFKVLASGDSYNDIQMIDQSSGAFIFAPQEIRDSRTDIINFDNYNDLRSHLLNE